MTTTKPNLTLENPNRITWQELGITLARTIAKRSPDPSTQVGAVIMGKGNKVISMGYNGAARGYPTEYISWARTFDKEAGEDPRWTKYPHVIHAELNAILNAKQDIEGCTIYVTLFPCIECAKAIVQAGIKTVIYAGEIQATSAKYAEDWQRKFVLDLFYTTDITLLKIEG
jgi:dCMP deaminase